MNGNPNLVCVCWYIDEQFTWHLRHIYRDCADADAWYKGLEDPKSGSIECWEIDT